MSEKSGIVILGIFAADTAYKAKRLPHIAETLMGSGFTLGPGGKGSNQAIAAAKAGGKVTFISRVGNDAFGAMALAAYAEAGVKANVMKMEGVSTGAAFIFVDEVSGDNAIIVVPGAAGLIGIEDVEANRAAIESAAIFMTQLEQPLEAALHGLSIAKRAGATTIFNPAPASAIPDSIYGLCDFIVPNEVEAAELVGHAIETDEQARAAARTLIDRGAKAAVITLAPAARSITSPGRANSSPHLRQEVSLTQLAPVTPFSAGSRRRFPRPGASRGRPFRLRYRRDRGHTTGHRPCHAFSRRDQSLAALLMIGSLRNWRVAISRTRQSSLAVKT